MKKSISKVNYLEIFNEHCNELTNFKMDKHFYLERRSNLSQMLFKKGVL